MKLLSQARNEILARPPANDLIQDLLPDSSSAYMLICGRSGIGKTFEYNADNESLHAHQKRIVAEDYRITARLND